ncbi:hypothetical protein KKB44_02465 [Candidatus Micrarchaeota archaeon]|nr:hypothetical protein [Candidatus Micrarchaeota archaeon]
MHLTKKLAYGNERPEQTKKLFFSGENRRKKLGFSAACVLTALSACAATAIGQTEIVPTIQQRVCGEEVESLLRDGEVVQEIVCKDDKTFVLTNTSLLVLHHVNDMTDEDGITFRLSYTRTDMQGILRHGLIAWAQSDDNCYFLTRDNMLRVIPLENMGDTISAYGIPLDVSTADMIYFDNTLFIAASGNVLMIEFGAVLNVRRGLLLLDVENPAFFIINDRLYFGDQNGERIEITGREN